MRSKSRVTHTLRQTRIERFAFDTNAIIYLLNRVEPYLSWLGPIFADVEAGRREAVVSVVTETETLIHPIRYGDINELERTRAFFSHPNLKVVDATRRIAWQAAQIRASLNLGLADSIIMATALTSGCDVVVGNDKKCATRFKDLTYLYLDDAVRQR